MHVHVDRHPDHAVVRPIGRFFGGDETIELERKLGALLDEDLGAFVVDLERTMHLNSSAITVLLAAHERAVARGVSMRLCNADRSIHNMLVILKLVNVMPVDAELAHAVAACRAERRARRMAPAAAPPDAVVGPGAPATAA
jgi:anti-anti-sigma factor